MTGTRGLVEAGDNVIKKQGNLCDTMGIACHLRHKQIQVNPKIFNLNLKL